MRLLDGDGARVECERARKTPVVPKNLNPVWNETFTLGGDFDIGATGGGGLGGASLELVVKDHDTFGKVRVLRLPCL